MNPITLYFLVFFPTLITIFIVVIFVRAYMVYKHALVMIKRIEPGNKMRFQTSFENISFSYKYTKGTKTTTSSPMRASVYWTTNAFVLIQEKKFLPLGSMLPIIFAASSDPHKTKNNFPDLDVYGIKSLSNVISTEEQYAFNLKSATQSDVSIELTLSGLNDEQRAFIRKGKR